MVCAEACVFKNVLIVELPWDDICILHSSAELKQSPFWLTEGGPDYNKLLRGSFEAHALKRGCQGEGI